MSWSSSPLIPSPPLALPLSLREMNGVEKQAVHIPKLAGRRSLPLFVFCSVRLDQT